jgi:hypothetical protein
MRILNLMGAAALAALMMTGATASVSAQPMHDGMSRHHMERRMMRHDRMMRHHERRMMHHRMMRERMMRHRMHRRMESM